MHPDGQMLSISPQTGPEGVGGIAPPPVGGVVVPGPVPKH